MTTKSKITSSMEHMLMRKSPTIYILQAEWEGKSFFKIGYTSNPPLYRLKAVQASCPFPLRLAACGPGTRADEKRMHELFGEYKIQGEWFRDTWQFHELIKVIHDDYTRALREMGH